MCDFLCFFFTVLSYTMIRYVDYVKNMKVCVISNIYPPFHRGGAEQVVVKTVEGLGRAGHSVIVMTSTPEKNGIENVGGITIYRKKPWNVFFYTDAHRYPVFLRAVWHILNMWNIQMVFWVWRTIKKEQIDIVHTHNLMGVSFLLPVLLRWLNVVHVHTVHDVQLVEPSGMVLKQYEQSWRYTGFPTQIYTSIMRMLFGSPDAVISPSEFLLRFYTSRGFFPQSKKVVIRNPMTFPLRAIQKEHVHSPMRFVYAGQIEYHKGVEMLIDAFIGLDASIAQQSELHIVGGGTLHAVCKKKTEGHPHIHIHKRMERGALSSFLDTMDMAVVPSLCYENSPTIIFESFSSGLPVLASNIEGVVELIKEGENGLMFEAGNIPSLQEKITWCVQHPDSILLMSHATKETIIHLTAEEYIPALETLYTT